VNDLKRVIQSMAASKSQSVTSALEGFRSAFACAGLRDGATLREINGERASCATQNGYLEDRARLECGRQYSFALSMTPQRIEDIPMWPKKIAAVWRCSAGRWFIVWKL